MESAEHLVRVLSLQARGVQVLIWEQKIDLMRAIVLLKAALPGFPDSPVLLPTEAAALLEFSIRLFEQAENATPVERRVILIPQGNTTVAGEWLNGWRRQLAQSPGTLIVIRRIDFNTLCRAAPDLMSFAQSDVHEVTELLPLVEKATLDHLTFRLSDLWYEALEALPGAMPSDEEIADWLSQLQSSAD